MSSVRLRFPSSDLTEESNGTNKMGKRKQTPEAWTPTPGK